MTTDAIQRNPTSTMTYPDLRELLLASPDFEERRRLLVLKDLYFKPSKEKVQEGFRYFDCELPELLDLLHRGDFEAILRLPFSLDEDGDPDTSDVCLLTYYTESGSLVALQPQQYRDYEPVNAATAIVLQGARARAVVQTVAALDQTR